MTPLARVDIARELGIRVFTRTSRLSFLIAPLSRIRTSTISHLELQDVI